MQHCACLAKRLTQFGSEQVVVVVEKLADPSATLAILVANPGVPVIVSK